MNNIINTAIFIMLLNSSCFSKPVQRAAISFTGDIIMHMPVRTSARHHDIISKEKKLSINNRGYDFLFEKTASYLNRSDVVIGNMEFPISPPFKSVPWIFNSYPDVIPAMQKAGFNVMFIANNHMLDQGSRGIISTLKFLNTYKMSYLGVETSEVKARQGIIKDINGIKTGFIGYTGVSNYRIPKKKNGYHINDFYSENKILEDINNIKKRCDYLVLIVHSGKEYSPVPLEKDVNLVKKYIEWGVDLVIRHHPHILQPAEKIKRKDGKTGYIFYSLGNFISNQGSSVRVGRKNLYASTRDSVIVTLVLTKKDEKLIPEFILMPVTTINIKSDSSGRRVIQTLPIPEEISRLKSEAKKTEGKTKIKIDKQIKLLLTKIETIKKTVFINGDIEEIRLITEETGINAIQNKVVTEK